MISKSVSTSYCKVVSVKTSWLEARFTNSFILLSKSYKLLNVLGSLLFQSNTAKHIWHLVPKIQWLYFRYLPLLISSNSERKVNHNLSTGEVVQTDLAGVELTATANHCHQRTKVNHNFRTFLGFSLQCSLAAAICSGSKRNTCQVSLDSLTSGKVVINFKNKVSDLFSGVWLE